MNKIHFANDFMALDDMSSSVIVEVMRMYGPDEEDRLLRDLMQGTVPLRQETVLKLRDSKNHPVKIKTTTISNSRWGTPMTGQRTTLSPEVIANRELLYQRCKALNHGIPQYGGEVTTICTLPPFNSDILRQSP